MAKKGKQTKKLPEDKTKGELVSVLFKGPQVYAVGAIGDWTPYDFRIGFYADIANNPDSEDEKKTYILQTQVILSPRATKELSEWLGKKVEEYEKENGIIETTEILKLKNSTE